MVTGLLGDVLSYVRLFALEHHTEQNLDNTQNQRQPEHIVVVHQDRMFQTLHDRPIQIIDNNMVTGLLGDVLSYVRLFALGLSGGILAGVFNSLAVGMSPDNVIAGPIVMVLIFVIGHAINMFMNVLGAMVHPMRLT